VAAGAGFAFGFSTLASNASRSALLDLLVQPFTPSWTSPGPVDTSGPELDPDMDRRHEKSVSQVWYGLCPDANDKLLVVLAVQAGQQQSRINR
jgi:hypothetical protein